MSEHCKAEVHYVDSDGVSKVDYITNFPFPVRKVHEDVIDFKRRVTQEVLRASRVSSRSSIGLEITDIKWVGPLGYHQGYLDMPVSTRIKYGEMPKLGV